MIRAYLRNNNSEDEDEQPYSSLSENEISNIRTTMLRLIRHGMNNDLYVSGNVKQAVFIGTRTKTNSTTTSFAGSANHDDPTSMPVLQPSPNSNNNNNMSGGIIAVIICIILVILIFIICFIVDKKRKENQEKKMADWSIRETQQQDANLAHPDQDLATKNHNSNDEHGNGVVMIGKSGSTTLDDTPSLNGVSGTANEVDVNDTVNKINGVTNVMPTDLPAPDSVAAASKESATDKNNTNACAVGAAEKAQEEQQQLMTTPKKQIKSTSKYYHRIHPNVVGMTSIPTTPSSPQPPVSELSFDTALGDSAILGEGEGGLDIFE